MQNGMLVIRLLYPYHRAYRAGYLTESALHSAVYRIEKLEKGEIIVVVFLDVEGTFNRTSTGTVREDARNQGVSKPLLDWLVGMPCCVMVETKLGSTKVTWVISRVCKVEYFSPPSDAWQPMGFSKH